MNIKASTDPFYRNGKARPLTAQDYANIEGISVPAAAHRIKTLIRNGKVIGSRTSRVMPMIYEVAT